MYLMDWSCCFWRSSSEMMAKEGWSVDVVALMGVFGVDLFFCREWSSSMVWAFTGVAQSSWHTSSESLWLVWIIGSPRRPPPAPLLAVAPLLVKLKFDDDPFSCVVFVFSSIAKWWTRLIDWLLSLQQYIATRIRVCHFICFAFMSKL